ncbi:hypothetical protein K461DRAFT_280314 [Myriangium duriaei CBS 260.36]|uniref:Dickkopf N-terminal cysteine-rich domain-containing protein n=1 Tax=Myriangium duriaei CBS 260.36 TaxID=1168546 RepID=A0A9P4IZ04_9PEZI|nr:hypothetical protein K461DRAFT_280314 [Myriangium duriaei CBS 260.36]
MKASILTLVATLAAVTVATSTPEQQDSIKLTSRSDGIYARTNVRVPMNRGASKGKRPGHPSAHIDCSTVPCDEDEDCLPYHCGSCQRVGPRNQPGNKKCSG